MSLEAGRFSDVFLFSELGIKEPELTSYVLKFIDDMQGSWNGVESMRSLNELVAYPGMVVNSHFNVIDGSGRGQEDFHICPTSDLVTMRIKNQHLKIGIPICKPVRMEDGKIYYTTVSYGRKLDPVQVAIVPLVDSQWSTIMAAFNKNPDNIISGINHRQKWFNFFGPKYHDFLTQVK